MVILQASQGHAGFLSQNSQVCPRRFFVCYVESISVGCLHCPVAFDMVVFGAADNIYSGLSLPSETSLSAAYSTVCFVRFPVLRRCRSNTGRTPCFNAVCPRSLRPCRRYRFPKERFSALRSPMDIPAIQVSPVLPTSSERRHGRFRELL